MEVPTSLSQRIKNDTKNNFYLFLYSSNRIMTSEDHFELLNRNPQFKIDFGKINQLKDSLIESGVEIISNNNKSNKNFEIDANLIAENEINYPVIIRIFEGKVNKIYLCQKTGTNQKNNKTQWAFCDYFQSLPNAEKLSRPFSFKKDKSLTIHSVKTNEQGHHKSPGNNPNGNDETSVPFKNMWDPKNQKIIENPEYTQYKKDKRNEMFDKNFGTEKSSSIMPYKKSG